MYIDNPPHTEHGSGSNRNLIARGGQVANIQTSDVLAEVRNNAPKSRFHYFFCVRCEAASLSINYCSYIKLSCVVAEIITISNKRITF